MKVEEIERFITPEEVKTNQILSVAMITGVLLFLVIVIVFYFQSPAAKEIDENYDMLLSTLSMVLLIVSLTSYSAAMYLPKIITRKNFEKFKNDTDNGGVKLIIGFYRTRQIIKLALFEAPSIFGLVVLLLSVKSGVLFQNEFYWLTTLPVLVFVYNVLVTFPSKEKIINFYRELF